MNAEVYKADGSSMRYYIVPVGTDLSKLPEKVNPEPWKSIVLIKGAHRMGMSDDEAMMDIQELGYHVRGNIDFEE